MGCRLNDIMCASCFAHDNEPCLLLLLQQMFPVPSRPLRSEGPSQSHVTEGDAGLERLSLEYTESVVSQECKHWLLQETHTGGTGATEG